MQEIFPGLYAITRMGCNSFIIESAPDELTVIDTGIPGSTRAILASAKSLNYAPEQIKNILITHADFDHIGSLADLAQATGATVYAGKESVHYIENAKTPPHVPSFLGAMTGAFQKKATVNEIFDDNDTLDIADGILAIHVPGHTPENYNFFWRREGVLFGADLFFALTKNLTLSPSPITWNRDELHKSARRALALAPKYICPGHGRSVNLIQTPEALMSLRRKLDGGMTQPAI
ncbi:MAG: MBL fold metallo-hydrolase [Phototrophicaceae bacterium]